MIRTFNLRKLGCSLWDYAPVFWAIGVVVVVYGKGGSIGARCYAKVSTLCA